MTRPTAVIACTALLCGLSMAAGAAPPPDAHLVLEGHRFAPDRITVPAGQRLRILVTNRDTTPDEFESPALRVERIVMPGRTIAVLAGPLSPGTYKVFDDYHPDTARGIVEAR